MSNEIELVFKENINLFSQIKAAVESGKTVIIHPPAKKCGTCGELGGHLSSCP